MGDEQPPVVDAGRPDGVAEPAPEGTGRRRAPGVRDRHRLGDAVLMAAAVVAAVTAAAVIGVASGLLTLLGWGAAVVVVLVTVGIVAAIRPRPANRWLLVPLLALALPAAGVAISGTRVLPQRGEVIEAPATAAEIPSDGYRAGFGDLLVDLRNLDASDADQIVIRAGSDLGRTVVALPQHRCFNLDVRWRTGSLRLPRVRERPTTLGFPPEGQLTYVGQMSLLDRKRSFVPGRIVLFGRAHDRDRGHWVAPTGRAAPTLTLELASEGGSFVVRDYPDRIAPLSNTAWPIHMKHRIATPTTSPETRAEVKRLKRAIAERVRRAGTAVGMDPRTVRRQIAAEAHRRVHDPLTRQWMQRLRAFSAHWLRSFTGTCNRRGTFR